MGKQSTWIIGLAVATGLNIVATGIQLLNDSGGATTVNIVEGSEELTGPSVAPLLQAMTDSGAGDNVVCRTGVIANRPPVTVYCTDDETAGFTLATSTSAQLTSRVQQLFPDTATDALGLIRDGSTLYVYIYGVQAP